MEFKKSPMGFWETLPKPFICMAPLADVTDAAFRRIYAHYGKPDITYTEFVSADGLFLRPATPGVDTTHGISVDHPLLKDLIFDDTERPIVAQFFSRDPDRMRRAAALAHDLGFDGIDINMGCPADVICGQGAGAAIIKEPKLAQEIIQATIEGARGLPVSVKTRIGFHNNEIETWLPKLLEAGPAAIALHARTRKEMSKVPAHWDIVTRAVEIRNEIAPHILIVGNGDVESREEALSRVAETGCDGVMVGRGIFGNPWFFNPDVKKENLPAPQILSALLEHTKLFQELLGNTKSFAVMKKHFKSYLDTIPNSKPLRTALMEQGNSYEEVSRLVEGYMI